MAAVILGNAHQHPVTDTDAHFLIDVETKQIANPGEKIVVVQGDYNSERITFDIDKLADGHDLSKSNAAEIHYLNIGDTDQKRSAGVYVVKDLTVENGKITFSWLISSNATKFPGALVFLVKFKCLEGEEVVYVWNTERYNDLSVSEGLDNGEAIAEKYADILSEWEIRIKALEEGAGTVKTVNGQTPDENGNVEIEIPEGIATQEYVQEFVQEFATENLQGIATEEYVDSKLAEPVSIDLSAYESEGRIEETFADGSSVTTVMEFDENGKPAKITDSNGNVTDLIGFNMEAGGGSGGSVTPAQVAAAVESYLEKNPVPPGADGKTPVKGVDYFTEEDKQEIAEQAAGMVEVPGGGGWELLQEITLEEEVHSVTFETPAEYNNFHFQITATPTSGQTTSMTVYSNEKWDNNMQIDSGLQSVSGRTFFLDMERIGPTQPKYSWHFAAGQKMGNVSAFNFVASEAFVENLTFMASAKLYGSECFTVGSSFKMYGRK
jgi:hypothetical protein